MALSMEEQRILAEIERQLADDDPPLAARLSTFGRPGLTAILRTPRGRVLASFLAVAVVAVLSVLVYSLVPLRGLPDRAHVRSTAAPSRSEQTTSAGQPAAGKAPAGHRPAAKTPAAAGSRTAKPPAAGSQTAAAPAARATATGRPPRGQASGERRSAVAAPAGALARQGGLPAG